MEKRYTITAELFQEIKDVTSILKMPHIMQHIKSVDAMTARDIIDISMQLDLIETRRVLNNVLRTAFINKDARTIQEIRAVKEELDNAPEGVDALG